MCLSKVWNISKKEAKSQMSSKVCGCQDISREIRPDNITDRIMTLKVRKKNVSDILYKPCYRSNYFIITYVKHQS